MGLRARLSRSAACRAHVLIVETPGACATRMRLERAVVERGWRLALSPADADVLAVCGRPGPELRGVVARLWEQMPGPRVRVDLWPGEHPDSALDLARDGLVDVERQAADARSRPAEPDVPSNSSDDDDEPMDHGDMDHGDMQMAPGGIALAEGDGDRDGLEMDVLHLPLGPVLPHWPAGLVLTCSLHGDVIAEASGRIVDGQGDTETDLAAPVWRWDNIARLLALAGWEHAAARARALRDEALSGDSSARGREDSQALRRHLARSRTLRWSLRGLGPLGPADLPTRGLSTHLAGDAYDRLLAMLDRVVEHPAVDLRAARPLWQSSREVSPGAVATAMAGLELATARLVVASLDLPPVTAPAEISHA